MISILSMIGECVGNIRSTPTPYDTLRTVILLDVTQKESFSRTPRNKIGGKVMKRDKFEKNKEFSTKISNLYRTVAKKKQWKIINATKSKIEVHEEILKIFSKKLGL